MFPGFDKIESELTKLGEIANARSLLQIMKSATELGKAISSLSEGTGRMTSAFSELDDRLASLGWNFQSIATLPELGEIVSLILFPPEVDGKKLVSEGRFRVLGITKTLPASEKRD